METLVWTVTLLSKQEHPSWVTRLVIYFFFLACSSDTIEHALYSVAVMEQVCFMHIPYKDLFAKTL